MIKLLVDEAYAFDYLSILFIKREYGENNYNKWKECENFLKTQFSQDQWNTIINSAEFNSLISINRMIFDAVEKARNNNISAQELDNKNMERFYSKQTFQNNLFPNIPLCESKII